MAGEDSVNKMQARAPRGKTLTGLTSIERSKHVNSLMGSSMFSSEETLKKVTQLSCRQCAEHRELLLKLQQEFFSVRDRLISEKRVLNFAGDATTLSRRSSNKFALVQEGAKLRLTIDTLMRFQVCSRTHTQIALHSQKSAKSR